MQHDLPRSFDAIVISDSDAAEALGAIESTGGRVRRLLSWRDIAEVARVAGRPTLVVEAIGVSADTLADALPRLDSAAVALGLPVVVALDHDQIDTVAAFLLDPAVHLLCAPTLAERVAELVLAAQVAEARVHDIVSEGEAARLARLNQEVARIAEVLARLSRQEDVAVLPRDTVAERALSYAPPPGDAPPPQIDAAEIRRVIRARRLRDKAFGPGWFEDPAWDMMLDLFAASLERAEVSVSSLCIAAAVAPTTALRWISRLTSAGLFIRKPDPFDRRRALMSLSETAIRGLRAYLGALRSQGLPFV